MTIRKLVSDSHIIYNHMKKTILTFESFSNSIDSYLEECTFDNLPLNFKKGLLTWMVEGDPVDWTFDLPITDWINGDNGKLRNIL